MTKVGASTIFGRCSANRSTARPSLRRWAATATAYLPTFVDQQGRRRPGAPAARYCALPTAAASFELASAELMSLLKNWVTTS